MASKRTESIDQVDNSGQKEWFFRKPESSVDTQVNKVEAGSVKDNANNREGEPQAVTPKRKSR